MTAEAIREIARYVFIPVHLAAVCADCHGYFLAEASACPGCGSRQYLFPANFTVEQVQAGANPATEEPLAS